ncbi:MAG: ATP-binding protein [Bacteroidota bacterium]
MLRKTIALFICLLTGWAFPLSGQTKVDSLTQLLNTQKPDTNKVATYLQLYESLKFEQQDRALEYLRKSLELSFNLDFQRGQLNGLLAKGEYFETTGYQDSALVTYQKAQKVGEKLDQRRGIIESFIGMGSAFSALQRLNEADSIAFLGIELAESVSKDSLSLTQFYTILSNTAYFRNNYEKSIGFDRKALEYNASDLRKRAKSFLNIGTTYDLLGDYEKSGKYYQKALEAAKAGKEKRMIALVQSEMGLLKVNVKEFAEARKLLELSLIHFEAVNDKVMMAHVQDNLARMHVELGEFDQAIAKLNKALSLASEINSVSSEAHFTYQLALAYYKKKEYPNAEKYFLEAKSKFDALEESNMQTLVLSRLSDLYAATNDYKKAFEYLQLVKTRDDSLLTATSAKNIAEMEEKYQNEQKQQEIELLSAENEIASLKIQKQTNLRNYLILAAFLLLVIIGVVYNRYQLKNRANLKLKELDTLKTNFFTNISHEFRTPLTLILSPLQELMGQKNNTKTANALSVIHRNAKVLTNLTNQLLDLSKLEAGELALQVKEEDLKQFLKVVSASFESLAVAQSVHFITQFEKAPEAAFFDGDKVQKILNNLLSNAFKFTSEEGEVHFTAFNENGLAVITVKDTGPGIPPEDINLIFNRFHQSSKNAPNTAGTGVGLTLSKELAFLHHGDISVESSLGEGTTFTLKFPFHKSAYRPNQIGNETDKNVQPSQITKPGGALTKVDNEINTSEKVVLLVEDNPDLSNHMRSLLDSAFQVQQSINGKVGIQDALTIIPDIIITDLMMPEVDGVELCQTLKADEKTSHIPIIMLTAKADRDTKLDGLKTGADDFLTKPFDNEELKVRVQNLIGQRDKLREKFEQTLRLAPSKIEVKSPEEAFIKKALEIIDGNLSNSAFTVETFQKEMGMSRMQLHRKLKALTHFSASEFIRDIRLQRAANLLTDKSLTVSEVAYSCGFNSVSYFTQCFTQKFGVNPSKHSS